MQITLTLDVNEVNTVLQIIAKASYEVAEPLIAKIKGQAQPQVDAAAPVSTTVPAPANE